MRLTLRAARVTASIGLVMGLSSSLLSAQVRASERGTVTQTISGTEFRRRLDRLMAKTATMLNSLDDSIPTDLPARTNIAVRHEFFGAGYGISNEETDAAVTLAKEQLGLQLEPTYTGKALAALLHDLVDPTHKGETLLFWNTYNSCPLPGAGDVDLADLPAEFMRYFD